MNRHNGILIFCSAPTSNLKGKYLGGGKGGGEGGGKWLRKEEGSRYQTLSKKY